MRDRGGVNGVSGRACDVDPIWWSPPHFRRRLPTWPKPARLTRLNFVDKWLNWSAPAVMRMNHEGNALKGSPRASVPVGRGHRHSSASAASGPGARSSRGTVPPFHALQPRAHLRRLRIVVALHWPFLRAQQLEPLAAGDGDDRRFPVIFAGRGEVTARSRSASPGVLGYAARRTGGAIERHHAA